jgi:hypothetical protein
MTEAVNTKENKEIQFDRFDLTPFEHVMAGGSVDIVVNGKKIFFNEEVFKSEEVQSDLGIMKVILTPTNLTQGKKTLEEIRQSREIGEIYSMGLSYFEHEAQFKYLQKDIRLTLKPGELDENGRLKTFGVYFSQNKQKVNLPENAPGKIAVKNEFKSLINFAGNENGVMQYEVNAGGS